MDDTMSLDAQSFKEVLSRFASGVTVVTTAGDGGPYGVTVSAFSALSARPPCVLICLGNHGRARALIEQAGYFAVHILGEQQVTLGPRFARLLPQATDLFAGIQYRVERTGAPVLEDCLAWLDCSVHSSTEVGDHTLFVGVVEALGTGSEEGEPILYYRRGFRVLAPGKVEL